MHPLLWFDDGKARWGLPLYRATAEWLLQYAAIGPDRAARGIAPATAPLDPCLWLWMACATSAGQAASPLHAASSSHASANLANAPASLCELADRWLASPVALKALADSLSTPHPSSATSSDLRQLLAQSQSLAVRGRNSLPAWLTTALEQAAVVQYSDDSAAPVADATTLAALAGLCDQLARLRCLETQFAQTLEASKLSAMAELAAGAGHEINNPLAIISGRLQLMLKRETAPERRRELAALNAQTVRIYEMIADLMLFARPPQPQHREVDLQSLLDEVVSAVRSTDPEQSEIAVSVSAPIQLFADRAQLATVLRALTDNAIEAAADRAGIEIACSLQGDAGSLAGETVVIEVSDDGPGISAEVREHLFDPFYSGRQAGRGLGMGLAKCWRIITQHGGKITVENRANADSPNSRGTRFRIELPRNSLQSAAGAQLSQHVANDPVDILRPEV